MKKFYFTFGHNDQYPYSGGYVVVEGRSREEAVNKYRSKYPDVHPDTVNCAFIYTERDWKQIVNRNRFVCHDYIAAPPISKEDTLSELYKLANGEYYDLEYCNTDCFQSAIDMIEHLCHLEARLENVYGKSDGIIDQIIDLLCQQTEKEHTIQELKEKLDQPKFDPEELIARIKPYEHIMSEAEISQIGKGFGHKYYKAVSTKRVECELQSFFEEIRKSGKEKEKSEEKEEDLER